MSPRKVVQDMVPSSRKPSLKDVMPVSRQSFTREDLRAIKEIKELNTPPIKEIPSSQPVILERPKAPKRMKEKRPKNPNEKGGHKFIWISLVIVILAAIVFAVFFISAKADVVIVPKQQAVTVDASFTACKDSPCTSAGANGLTYALIQIPPTEIHQIVPATTGSPVQTKAQGSIILYNNYSTAAQTITMGTRLTNTAGNIYLTAKTVTVPGLKGKTPGSASVSVIAQTAGAQYNIAPTDLTGDFKIVAYKGTSKYDAFYGRLNPNNSISGGTSGNQQIVASSTLAAVYASLQSQLGAQLSTESKSLIPQGYIMYDGAYSINYQQLAPTSTTTAGMADVGVRATFSGIMFRQSDLVKASLQKSLPNVSLDTAFPNGAYSTAGLSALTYTVIGTSTAPLMFKLSGAFTITGTFPIDDIKQRLLGQDLAQSNTIFASYSTIATAHAIISPFWRHTFPDTPSKITITTQ